MRIKGKYSQLSDEVLMTYLEKGDKPAFDELYFRYSKIMLSYFRRMLWNDHEKAEDFVHDLSVDIGQPKRATLIRVSKLLMI